jgi:hypothetical protein
MTRAPFEVWQAQVAPDVFAERTAAAVLRDRALARRSRRGPWVLLAAAACILVAGVAWGWTSLRKPPPREMSTSRLEPVERTDPTPSATSQRPVGTSEVLLPTPHPAPVHAKSKAPASPPSAVPEPSARKVPLPQCTCNAFACECGPE